MSAGVSVIICCYNSASRIPDTLNYIASQDISASVPWEVIVVDNASTDDTRATAQSAWQKYNRNDIAFKIIDQPVLGLSYAREKGIQTACYDFLIFCDDDNWLYENYVAKVFDIMSKDPKIGVLGGCGIFEPEEPVNTPIIQHKISYVNGPQPWAGTEHWVYGAGAAYSKAALNKLNQIGWRPITTGRQGNKLTAGEDVEFCFMVYLLGYTITSSELLLFKHFVPLKRQNLHYILRLVFGQAYSYVLLLSYLKIINNRPASIQSDLRSLLLTTTKGLMYMVWRVAIKNILVLKPLSFDQKKTVTSAMRHPHVGDQKLPAYC
jgi:glycosyltransferase involved in cell wall biosynthesis